MSIPDNDPAGFRGRFLRDEEARLPFREASGILRLLPDAVAVPEDAADVAALVRWAADTRTPLVPRGAGTGMPGGNVGRGVSVDLVTRFRGVERVDPGARLARVLPGTTRAELNAACAPHGLHFPVDPSSGARATLGGIIANNSAGSHSVKYGAARAWVEALELVLADGTRATLARGREPEEPRLRAAVERVRREVLPGARGSRRAGHACGRTRPATPCASSCTAATRWTSWWGARERWH